MAKLKTTVGSHVSAAHNCTPTVPHAGLQQQGLQRALVTVAIPTYNRVGSLKRAIESALAQDYQNIEVIISDNASTDGTNALCKAFMAEDSRIRYFRLVKNLGATENFRFAPKLASGEYFMWLADDDWLDPSYVRRCVELHETHPGTALACGGAVFHLAEGMEKRGIVVEVHSDRGSLRVLKYLALVRDNSGFYGLLRKSALCRISLNNVLGGDWLFVVCLAYLGKIRVDRDVLLHRSPSGASNNFANLVSSFGFPSIAKYFPYIVMAREVVCEISRNKNIFGSIGLVRRYLLAYAAAVALLVSQGVIWRIVSRISQMLTCILGSGKSAALRSIIRGRLGV